jgi:Asp/Glu/hydantoin racemase
MSTNIALIHAIYAAVSPVEQAFADDWPEANLTSLLAEDLTQMLSCAGKQTDNIRHRIQQLTNFATQANVDGILFTCSAFGDSIEAARKNPRIPILKPNEAMFEEALELGGRVGMLVTFEAAIASMANEYAQVAHDSGKENTLETHYVPGALDAINSGKVENHHHLLAQAAEQLPSYDVLMLAQFSMSGAKSNVEKSTDAKVLTSPGSAIMKLKKLISA